MQNNRSSGSEHVRVRSSLWRRRASGPAAGVGQSARLECLRGIRQSIRREEGEAPASTTVVSGDIAADRSVREPASGFRRKFSANSMRHSVWTDLWKSPEESRSRAFLNFQAFRYESRYYLNCCFIYLYCRRIILSRTLRVSAAFCVLPRPSATIAMMSSPTTAGIADEPTGAWLPRSLLHRRAAQSAAAPASRVRKLAMSPTVTLTWSRNSRALSPMVVDAGTSPRKGDLRLRLHDPTLIHAFRQVQRSQPVEVLVASH